MKAALLKIFLLYHLPHFQVELLQKQLHGLQLDRVLGSETTTGAEHPYQAILMRDLKTQVEALKVEDDGSRSSAGGLPVYEVYTRTEAAKFAHFSKVSGRLEEVL